MITSVELANFKRFKHALIETRAMTVFTGVNGAGKSTIIQALLLARHATEFVDRTTLPLNGPHGLSLGEAEDVLHLGAEQQTIEITLGAGAQSYPYRFTAPEERSLYLEIGHRPAIAPAAFKEHGRRFAYLCAERLGPRDQLQVTAEDSAWLGVGEQGQYTAQVLATENSTTIRPELLHPKTSAGSVKTLRAQVEHWVEDVIRPIRIDADWLPGLNASMIRFAEPGWLGSPIRPSNMGFGFSYALPIIVAGLLMPRDGLIIVENPEAHLHPGGQSKLGRFLTRVAGSGAQVVVETHSDHVLNGIRLGIADNRWLDHSDAIVHYFSQTTGPSALESVEMNEHGDLAHWPQGFFDQIDADLGGLARARRDRRTANRP